LIGTGRTLPSPTFDGSDLTLMKVASSDRDFWIGAICSHQPLRPAIG